MLIRFNQYFSELWILNAFSCEAAVLNWFLGSFKEGCKTQAVNEHIAIRLACLLAFGDQMLFVEGKLFREIKRIICQWFLPESS